MYPQVKQLETARREAREVQKTVRPLRLRLRVSRPVLRKQPAPCAGC